jgi:UDP-3-O-[3-hydroxymyristoyl] N-acetylglucosamine deacetylase/3-hydroxyacyl-[acyl-carrier-protein] dehydratase
VWIDAPVTEEMRREMNSWWPGVSLACDGAGLLESQRLRWPDECARHKLLDLLGDLALLRPVVPCRVAAIQSGHALAHRLVRQCALGQHARETMADLEGSYG